MNKKTYIYHIEFFISIVLLMSVLYVELNRDVSVKVEADDTLIQKTHNKLTQKVDQFESLHELYTLNMKELRTASIDSGLDRLSSEDAIVGCVFYVEEEPYYYYLTLQEYLEAKFNILPDSVSNEKSYIRPLTPDIKFLGKQFIERYPDKTERALAILHLIQNLKFKENEDVVKHPTVTLMEGGSSLDITIACGALLKAADIDCAMLIFKNSSYVTIGISNIIFENLPEKLNKNTIIEFNGQKYLIVDIVFSQNLGENGSQDSVTPENIDLIIPYEFP